MRITLPSPSGFSLVGDVSFPDAMPAYTIVAVHGFGSARVSEKIQALRQECLVRGWPIASFDFHGHGESGGQLVHVRAAGLIDDLACVRDYLFSCGVRRLFLVGSSMGGWAALWFAARNPGDVAGVVGIAPAVRFVERRWERLSPDEQRQWQETGRIRFQNDWIDSELGYGLVADLEMLRFTNLVQCLQTPTLLIHGMADEVVSVEDTMDFVRQVHFADVELHLIKNGDHRLKARKAWLATFACDWIAARLN